MVGGDVARPGAAGPVFGREDDVRLLRAFVDRASIEGGAMLLSGEAGVGKTVLLDVAEAHASAIGARVLRAAGAEFEADVSFAGLNQLLRPLFGELDQLSALHSQAMRVALGLGDGPPSNQLVLSNAALALLVQASAQRALLVIIDDLPWLDRASASVLGFIARRLTGGRVGFLAASRTEEEGFFERRGIPRHEVGSLDETSAAALLEDRFPALSLPVRQRLVAAAQGNPLALLELPVALRVPPPDARQVLPTVLALTARLQAVFASRIEQLPDSTRQLLLLAALDGTGDRNLLHRVTPGQRGLDDLAPAERARIVSVDEADGRLAFRHPLIRSAVVQLSTSEERRQAHQILATHLAEPERRVWHLAEATVGPDEGVAALLQGMARNKLRRGDAVGAITELLRAADLSPAGPDRSRRLAEAAYVGATVLGDMHNSPQLLDAVREADPEHGGSLAGAVASAYNLLNGDGDVDTAHRLLVGAIETTADPSDAHNTILVEAIYNLLEVCFFAGRAELWEPFERAIGRLEPGPPEVLSLLVKLVPDPARQAVAVLKRLETAIASLDHETNASRIVRVANATCWVDRIAPCRSSLWRVVHDGRAGGAITSSIQALGILGIDAYMTGQWDELELLTEEGLTLCETHQYALMRWPARFEQALLGAARGDSDTVRAVTDEMLGWAVPRRVRAVHAFASHARALHALGQGDFDDAYQHATAISPAGTIASHIPHALWLVMDLTEAAVHTGRHAEAVAHVAAATDAGIAAISTRLALITGASAALVAVDSGHDEAFQRALHTPGADAWPFDLARVRLLFGERLRRDQDVTRARHELAAALEIFQRLRARPWATRAANELRATGQSLGIPQGFGLASLTPQEREIATLAASGLTNKQIGERLFLSHRTVGTHLYQLFPKLGVTSRAALRDALTVPPTDPPSADP